MSEPDKPSPVPDRPAPLPRAGGMSTSDATAEGVPELQIGSFGATVWQTVVRVVPVLAVALLCLVAVVLWVLFPAAPSGMVAAAREGGLLVAPSELWSVRMWLSVVGLLLVVAVFLTWAHAYATVVAGAAAVGRDIGAGAAAILALRAVRRLAWPAGALAALMASLTVVHWALVAVPAAVLAWVLHPVWPMAVFTRSPFTRSPFTRSPRRRIDDAVALGRGQGSSAAVATALLGLVYWWWSDQASRQHLGTAVGAVWAVGLAVLIAVTGAVLAWGLLRHLRWPPEARVVREAADWLTEVTRPRAVPLGRRVAVAAVSAAVAVGLCVVLSVAPVTTRAADSAGRAPSWTALLPGGSFLAGSDGLGAAVAGDLVVVAVNQANPPGVVVYDRRGVLRWAHRYHGEQFHGLRFWVTGDAVVLYGRNHQEFRVLDLRTGRVRFSVGTRPNVIGMVTERTLVVTGRLTERHCEHPLAFDLRTGKRRWERTDRCLLGLPDPEREGVGAVPWMAAGRGAQPAAATDTSVVWARITPDSVVGRPRYATLLDLETGKDLVAPYQVPTEVYQVRYLGNGLYLDVSQPQWSDLCEGGRRGPERRATLQPRDLRTGAPRWTAEVGQWNVTGGRPCHPEAVRLTAEGLLTATPRGGLQLLDMATGKPRWTLEDAGPVAAALSGPTLIVQTWRTRHLGVPSEGPGVRYTGLDTRTGAMLWSAECVGDSARVTPRRFVCRRAEPIGDSYAADRVWVTDLRSGRLEWATRGIPLWAGPGGARLVQAGADWLMTYRVEGTEPGRIRLRVQMYDRSR